MEAGASGNLDRVVDHYVGRLRRGEHPNVEDYVQRHPDLADEIRELFPLLSMMEGVKGGEGAARGGGDTQPETSLPQTIAAYDIVRPIGRGGMGAVYEGRAADGSRVAVKVIHPHLLGEARYVARNFLFKCRRHRRSRDKSSCSQFGQVPPCLGIFWSPFCSAPAG